MNTILDSVSDIVRGNISGVAAKIEDVLSQMVLIIIGFLAEAWPASVASARRSARSSRSSSRSTRPLDVIKTGLKLAGPVIRGIAGSAPG